MKNNNLKELLEELIKSNYSLEEKLAEYKKSIELLKIEIKNLEENR